MSIDGAQHVPLSTRESAAGLNAAAPEPCSVGTTSFLAKTMILIPALNEEECIGATVKEWLDLGAGKVRVVDNGSTDSTRIQAEAAGAEVLVETTRGYGAACWTGLISVPVDLDWILFSSADGSDRMTSSELQSWQKAVDEGHSFVLGNRCLLPGAVAHLKWLQRFGSWLAGALMYAVWKVRFADMGSRRMIRVDAFRQLKLEDRAFGWNVEMQIRAVEEGLRWTELPVHYFPRRAGHSKISGNWRGTIKASYGILSKLMGLAWTRRSRVNQVKRSQDASGASSS